MKLELGIVLSCDAEGCRVQLVDGGETLAARYSEPVRQRIRIAEGHLVAVDRASSPPEIVWRLARGRVRALDGPVAEIARLSGNVDLMAQGVCGPDHATPLAELEQPVAVGDIVFYSIGKQQGRGTLYDVAVDGRPAHPERVGRALFPEVEAYYAGLQA